MSRLIIIAAMVLTGQLGLAQVPVSLFVKDLLQTRGDNVWFVEDDSSCQPQGGYIYRFDLDVEDDGSTETFVSTSLDAGRKGEMWTVFRKRVDDAYYVVKQSQFLASDLFLRDDNEGRKYSFYVPQKEVEGGPYFGYFWLDREGVWHDETHVLNDAEQATIDGEDPGIFGPDGKADDDKIADKLKLGHSVEIDIKKVLLAKYIQDPNIVWRPVNPRFSLSLQYKDPADAADMQSIQGWTPPEVPVH
jgi:hypothetical protein